MKVMDYRGYTVCVFVHGRGHIIGSTYVFVNQYLNLSSLGNSCHK